MPEPRVSPQLVSRLEGLAWLGLLACIFLSPVVSVVAPRAIGVLLPVVAFAGLPFFLVAWNYRPPLRLTFWLAALLALLVFGLYQTPVQDRALSLVYVILGEGLALLCGLFALTRMDATRLVWLLRALALALLITGGGLLCEWLLDMPINRLIRVWVNDTKPVQLFFLDRTIILFSLLLWPLLAWQQAGRLALLALLVIEALILQTSSQAAGLALGVGIVVFLLTCWRPVLMLRALRLGVLVGMIAAPLLVPLLNEIFGLKHDLWHQASAGERLRLWSLTSLEILNHPWLGHGLEAARSFGNWGRVRGHPHNGVLQLWAEFGLLGILLAGLFVRWLLMRIEGMATNLRPYALAAFAAWLMVFCVGYSIWQPWWLATAAVLVMLFVAVERLWALSASAPASAPAPAPAFQ